MITSKLFPKPYSHQLLQPDICRYVYKLDIYELETVPSNLKNLKAHVNEVDNTKLDTVLLD